MADRIKGIVVEIGGDTTGLNKALSDVNKELRDNKSALTDIERLLKMDPGNTELLQQKFELLSRSVESTEEKLEALKEAEKQVQQQLKRGEVSEDQYNALKREIIATESSLKDLKQQAQKTENAVNGIEERPIEEVADAANEAADNLEDAGKKASSFGDYLKADLISSGAKGIISSMKDMAEETEEYQKIMASLEVSSERAGYTAEETADSYKQLYGVLADDQTAATTTANLQALGLEQDKLIQITNATIGAWATYGDSIPIDGLAEAINETAKVGTVTGGLADVLNWAGVSEDEFNEKLATAGTTSGRVNMILKQLAKQGLVEAGESWQENNKNIIESNQASADFQQEMAELGALIQPILTEITKSIAKLLGRFNDLDSGSQVFILTIIGLVAVLGPLQTAIGGVSAAITFLAANPIILAIAAIVGLVALIATKGDEIQGLLNKVDDFLENIFLVNWTDIFGEEIGSVLDGFMENIEHIWISLKMILDGIIDFIRGVFTGDWERAWIGIVEMFAGLFNGLLSVAVAPLNGILGLINLLIDGINYLIRGLNKISFDFPDWIPKVGGKSFGIDIPEIPDVPYLAKGGVLYEGTAVVGEAGPEMLTVSGNRAIVQPLTNQTSSTTNNLGGISMVIYGAPGQDVNELADIIADKINNDITRKGIAYA